MPRVEDALVPDRPGGIAELLPISVLDGDLEVEKSSGQILCYGISPARPAGHDGDAWYGRKLVESVEDGIFVTEITSSADGHNKPVHTLLRTHAFLPSVEIFG
jgi:hypothetical protein